MAIIPLNELVFIASPINLVLAAIVMGYYVGQIKIYRFSLGISGILFVAIILGIIIKISPLADDPKYLADVKKSISVLTELGNAIFVSVIGYITGSSLKANTRRNMLSMLIGSIMAVAAIGVTGLATHFLQINVSKSTLLGGLCGALTSTPGLSAVCDGMGIDSAEAVLGYGCTYMFGVMITVTTVSLLSRKSVCLTNEQEGGCTKRYNVVKCLATVCFIAIVGIVVGSIDVPIIRFSLGKTGGILVAGTIWGAVSEKRGQCSADFLYTMNVYRNIGLALFLSGTGIATGLDFSGVNMRVILFGICLTGSSLALGFVLCRCVFAKTKMDVGSVLSGGMTSSPALGVLTEKGRGYSYGQFAFSYFGSLISLIIIIRLIVS